MAKGIFSFLSSLFSSKEERFDALVKRRIAEAAAERDRAQDVARVRALVIMSRQRELIERSNAIAKKILGAIENIEEIPHDSTIATLMGTRGTGRSAKLYRLTCDKHLREIRLRIEVQGAEGQWHSIAGDMSGQPFYLASHPEIACEASGRLFTDLIGESSHGLTFLEGLRAVMENPR